MNEMLDQYRPLLESLREDAGHIWHRGHGYIDNILQVEVDEHRFVAKIEGTYIYKTFIDFERQEIYCSCPAYMPCKHVCALAMAIEKEIIRGPLDLASISELALVWQQVDSQIIEFAALDKQGRLFHLHQAELVEKLTSPHRKIYQQIKKFRRFYTHLQLPFLHLDDLSAIYNKLDLTAVSLYAHGDLFNWGGFLTPTIEIDRGQINHDAFYKDSFSTNLEAPDARHYHYFARFSFQVPDTDESFVTHEIMNSFYISSSMLFLSSGQFQDDYGPLLNKGKKVRAGTHFYLVQIEKKHLYPNLTINQIIVNWHHYATLASEEVQTAVASIATAGPILVIDLAAEIIENNGREELALAGRVLVGYSRSQADLQNHQQKQTIEYHKSAPLLCVPPRKIKQEVEVVREEDTGLLLARHREKEEQLLADTKISIKYAKTTGDFRVKPRAIRKFIREKLSPLSQNDQVLLRTPPELMQLLKQKMVQAEIEILSSAKINWFNGQIKLKGISREDSLRILTAYREKQDHVRLSDQSWLALDQTQLSELVKDLEAQGIKIKKDGSLAELSLGDLVALDKKKLKLLEENEAEKRRNQQIMRLKNRLGKPRPKKKVKLDAGFQGQLRDYQVEGVNFFHFLYQNHLGGILADEMGLGKTVQAIAFMHCLLNEQPENKFLVVCPLSAMYVWSAEIEKFSPHLKPLLWHGPGRKKTPEQNWQEATVIITTYQTMASDQKKLAEIQFAAAFVDEAQQIKNYRSRAAKAIRQLRVGSFFCLTGTPLENHLAELWAHFDLVFSGLLGRRKAFLNTYGGNLALNEENYFLKRLRNRIRPFLLRRLKKDVVKELPAKTEKTIVLPMSKAQAVIYEKKRQQAVEELKEKSAGYLFRMLTHLTNLRRLSCHAMLPEATDNWLGEYSSKLQYLDGLLGELQERQGVIIFSQYTDFLARTQALLKERKIDFFYLDGQTPMKKRQQMVTAFQNKTDHATSPRFFLISLKAGGFALTLHRADTVIHLDPWYNPAVEDQATDRVHRIGQKKPVLVYKLISQGSVEEKVNQLKQKKQKLFDQMFSAGFEKSKKFSDEELRGLLEE